MFLFGKTDNYRRKSDGAFSFFIFIYYFYRAGFTQLIDFKKVKISLKAGY